MQGSALIRLLHNSPKVLGLVVLLGSCDFIESQLAPKAKLDQRWEAQDPESTAAIDHSAWAEFLNSYVSPGADGVSRVAYGRVSAAGQEQLTAYLSQLTALPISNFNRSEQLAYWVNLYNALTIDLVLTRYPIESIMDINISPGLLGFGPWGKTITRVEGRMLSLNDIEHRILRPIWQDPRIHYVLNCAAIGCPNLHIKPLTAENTERTLEAAARGFINHPRGVRIDEGRLIISKIYNWFSSDFGVNQAEVISHLKSYAAPTLAERLTTIRGIHGYEYSWRLNDAPSP